MRSRSLNDGPFTDTARTVIRGDGTGGSARVNRSGTAGATPTVFGHTLGGPCLQGTIQAPLMAEKKF